MIDFTTLYPVNPVLTALVCTTAYGQELIGRKLLPRIKVANSAYKGQIVRKSHTTRMGGPLNTLRAPGAAMARMAGSDPALVSYEARIYSLACDPIAPEHIARNQLPIDILGDEMESVTNKVDIDEEVRISAKLFGTSIWTAEPTLSSISISGGQWSTIATARPRGDLAVIREAYRKQAHGRNLDSCVIGPLGFNAFLQSLEARGVHLTTSGAAYIGGTLGYDAGKAMIAQDLGISPERVFVGNGRRNTAAMNQAHSEADIWGDFLWVGNLLGGSGQQAVGSNVRMSGDAVAMVGIDEETGFLNTMGSAPAGALRSLMAGYEQDPATKGGGLSGWVQQYADEVVLAADLGYLVQDLV